MNYVELFDINIKEKLLKAFDEVKKGSLSKQYVDTVTAYAAAVTGVISNLTISEMELREEEENDMAVIPCVHHKTASQGMAVGREPLILKKCSCFIMIKSGPTFLQRRNRRTSFFDILWWDVHSSC